jgi:hypothetical protein
MHRPETETEKRWKFYARNQVDEKHCMICISPF